MPELLARDCIFPIQNILIAVANRQRSDRAAKILAPTFQIDRIPSQD